MLQYWHCPNCGQVHFAEAPPDMCDVCEDFTTWMHYPPRGRASRHHAPDTESGSSLPQDDPDDPPVQPALFDL